MLNNALDCGITEKDFWDMTFAELDRAVDSKIRVQKVETKERATFDYILASLVGKAVSRVMASNVTFPEIHEVYPSLFDDNNQKNIEKQERLDQLSALRFKRFAQSYNNRFKEVGKDK